MLPVGTYTHILVCIYSCMRWMWVACILIKNQAEMWNRRAYTTHNIKVLYIKIIPRVQIHLWLDIGPCCFFSRFYISVLFTLGLTLPLNSWPQLVLLLRARPSFVSWLFEWIKYCIFDVVCAAYCVGITCD